MNYMTLAYINQLDEQYARFINQQHRQITTALYMCPEYAEESGFKVVLNDAIKTIEALEKNIVDGCVNSWLEYRLHKPLLLWKEGNLRVDVPETPTEEEQETSKDVIDTVFEKLESINTNLKSSIRFIDTIEHFGDSYFLESRIKHGITEYEDILDAEDFEGKIGVVRTGGFGTPLEYNLCLIRKVEETGTDINGRLYEGFKISYKILGGKRLTTSTFMTNVLAELKDSYVIQEPNLHLQYVRLSSANQTVLQLANKI